MNTPPTCLKAHIATCALTLLCGASVHGGCAPSTTPVHEQSQPESEGATPKQVEGEPQATTQDGTSAALRAQGDAQSEIDLLLAAPAREAWFGLYMLERKVGHAKTWTRKAGPGEAGGLVFGTEAHLRIKGPAGVKEVVLEETRFYDAVAPFGLVASELSESAQGGKTTRRVALRGDQLELREHAKSGAPRLLPATAETLHGVMTMSPLRVGALVIGEGREVQVFDWESLADQRVRVTPMSRSVLRRAGVDTPVVELEMEYIKTGLKMRTLMGEEGLALRTTLGAGLMLKLEEEAVARAEVRGLDVAGSGVPVSRALVKPREYESLSVWVSLEEAGTLPEGAGQQVSSLPNGTLALSLDTSPGPRLSAEERRAALVPHGPIDSDSPAIAAQALALVAGLDAPKDRVAALLKWVHETLRKELATHIPSASKVLEMKVGDCTEHTWLFVALARSLNIPARPVYGLMYIDERSPVFGYHAWAEVELDGRWVALDPTWGQLPADATHLRLGSDALEVAKVMGGISIALDAPDGHVK